MSDQMKRQLPLVVILGATACGKSKLAIDLARRFGGEIISADSMQVYRGLDIVTNKVTREEQAQAKHHMINFLDPLHKYSVVDFRNKSLSIIEELQKRNSLPIVVGGTNYYIESLLWKGFLVDTNPIAKRSHSSSTLAEDDEHSQETMIDVEVELCSNLSKDLIHTKDDLNDVEKFFKKPIYQSSFKDIDSEQLWKVLEQVDPETSQLCHHRNKRAVIRALQIYQSSGKKYSDCLKKQNIAGEDGRTSLGGPLRFKKTCVIWLDCDKDVLNTIVDQRVDQMLERGLLAELNDFHQAYNKQRVKDNEVPNYKTGIFQTIGFKEFHDYLILPDENKASGAGQELLKKSIEEMKFSTRRYVRKQIRWIRNRFLREGLRDQPDLFRLMTSFDEDVWQQQVYRTATRIVESFIDDTKLDDELLKLKPEREKEFVPFGPGKLYCEACDRTFIGSNQIESHLQSRRHKNELIKFKRKKEIN